MLKKKNEKHKSTEFTDGTGRKWVQTSAEDLFSSDEINDIIKSIEKDTSRDEIVLAHIDFKKVNREDYEALTSLQKELKRKDEILKKLSTETRTMMERKNRKLNELIAYIKKMHMIIALKKLDKETLNKINISPEEILKMQPADEGSFSVKKIENTPTVEIELDENGDEIE
ncbi:MAG: hypothetical protein JW982_16035 [Spirochaetes bacterium]|nr:hypothetical protein [Spirochaetota bacterium]